MEHCSADELNIVVDHIPRDGIACRTPAAFPDGLSAFDLEEVFALQSSIDLGCIHLQLPVLGPSSGRLLHYGEGLRPYQLEFFFAAFVDAFVQRFDLSVQTFSYLEGFFRFELGLYVIQAVLVLFIDGAKTIPE